MQIRFKDEVLYEDAFNLTKQIIKCEPIDQWTKDSAGNLYLGDTNHKSELQIIGDNQLAPCIKSEYIGQEFQVHLDLRLQQKFKNQIDYTFDPKSLMNEKGEWVKLESLTENDIVSFKPIIKCKLKSFEKKLEGVEVTWKLIFQES